MRLRHVTAAGDPGLGTALCGWSSRTTASTRAMLRISVGSALSPSRGPASSPRSLLVLRRARWPSRAGPGRWLEAVAPAFGTVFVTLLATRAPEANLLFLVSPFPIWAAFRFRLAGAAPCALVVSTLAIMAAAAERGPFASADVFENTVTLQAFNGTTALTALLLAAVITERDTTHEEIKRVRARLAEMVSRMEPGPESYEHPPENDTPP